MINSLKELLNIPASIRAFVLRLIAGVILVDLFVMALAGFFLYEGKIQSEQLAESRTSSIAQLLERNLNESIEEINLTLLTISDEIERQLTNNKIENISLEKFLTRQHERISEISRLLVANAKGEILFESKGLLRKGISIADRDYFIKLQKEPKAIVIGKPVLSATAGNWILPFARRVNNKDGSSAAIVIASIRLEYIQQLFSTIGLGNKDLAVLRGEDLGVIVRHPEPNGVGSTVGQKEVTNVFKEFVKSGKASLTYKGTSLVDNIERSFSTHKISPHKLYILVGLATSEYLKDWRSEVVRVLLLVLLFITGTIISSYYFVKMQKQERLKEEELRQTKAILQAAMDQSPAGIAIADAPDGKLRYVNDAGLLIRGSDRMSVVNGIGIDQYVASWQLLDLDGRPLNPDEVPLARAIMFGEKNSREFIIRRKEGDDCIVSANAAPIYDEAGKVAAGIVVFTDITERKFHEEQLKSTTQRLHLATSSAHLGVWDWNVRDNTMVWDDRMFELYGVKPDAFPSNIDAWTNGLHPDDKDRAIAECQAALNGEKKFDTIFRVLHPDGKVMYLKADAIVIRGADGKAERMLGINADISDRIQAEEQLRNREELYRNLFNNSEIAIFRSRLDGSEIFDVNQKFLDMLEMTREETIGKPSAVLWADPHEREQLVQQLLANGRVSGFEYKMLTKNGEIRNCITSLVLYPEQGIIEGSILDITKLKQAEHTKLELEQQFQHTQKLESLGVLAGGIAHDFNNILAIIVGHCSLAVMNPDSLEESLSEIEKAALRAAGLCRQMLAYAGKSQLEMTQVNLSLLVDEMVKMLRSSLPQNTSIKTALSANIPSIKGDESQLRQIVMNLIINASEAIGNEHGEISVSLAKIKVMAGKSYDDYNGKAIPPGEYVCLEVTDNGCGMDEETKWRIFEPFYTTKFTGRGLGMSAVLGIIMSHGGALQLFSQLGHGTTFKVYLPVQKDASIEDSNMEQIVQTPPWQGSGTILLVEDEDQVRKIARLMLLKLGFTVIEASNGKEALELYQKNTVEITLIVTDMGMPVMDGYELFYELKQLKPELPIIISSGFGDSDIHSRIAKEDIAGMITKPYTPDELREVLKNVIKDAV